MSILEKSYAYLKMIMDKEESFVVVMNRLIPNSDLSPSETLLVRDVLKSTVNKYYYLRFEIRKGAQRLNLELEVEETNVLVLGIAFIQYVKNMTYEGTLELFKEDHDVLPLKISLEQINALYGTIGEKPMELPPNVEARIAKKIALKYSYPEWIIRSMFKQYDVKSTYRSCAASRRGMPISVNINPLRMKDSDKLEETSFVKSSFSSRAYNYVGKEKIIDHPYFKSNRIFVEDEAYQILVEALDPNQGEEMLFIDDSKGVMGLDASLRVHHLAKINVALKDLIALNAARNLYHRFGAKAINSFESTPNLLITHVAPYSMDKVLLVAPSSRIGLVRKHPDILLTLRKQDLVTIIEEEKNLLNEVSQFVKPEGVIIYAVFTMNKNEGEVMIKNFLEEHHDFALLEERQVLPFDGPCDGFYYAKLLRNKENDED